MIEVLPRVSAPTLLIVGGDDHTVIRMNRRAFGYLGGVKEMEIVPGAGQLVRGTGCVGEGGPIDGRLVRTSSVVSPAWSEARKKRS